MRKTKGLTGISRLDKRTAGRPGRNGFLPGHALVEAEFTVIWETFREEGLLDVKYKDPRCVQQVLRDDCRLRVHNHHKLGNFQ